MKKLPSAKAPKPVKAKLQAALYNARKRRLARLAAQQGG